jgi:addiction module RelE/StbE family toxin
MKPVWSDEASRQLLETLDYIAQDNPRAASAVVANIRATAERLKTFPLAGRLDAEAGFRISSVPRSPYRLHYDVEADHVVILSVRLGARRWPPVS